MQLHPRPPGAGLRPDLLASRGLARGGKLMPGIPGNGPALPPPYSYSHQPAQDGAARGGLRGDDKSSRALACAEVPWSSH